MKDASPRSAFQQGALLRLIDAASRGDTVAAERAWRAIDAAFVRQLPSGDSEERGSEASAPARARYLSRFAVWLAQLCRAEIVVMNSPLSERFRWRVVLMLPKLRRSIDRLATCSEEMQAMHADRPDLLLVDAQAFLLADGIYHEPALNQLGQRTLVAALGKQGRDGAFAGRGGPTIANQARALESLVEIALYFPAPSLNEAAASAARWLARKIASKQHSGPAERADALSPSAAIEWRDGILALSYQASRVGDSKALASTIAWMGPSGR